MKIAVRPVPAVISNLVTSSVIPLEMGGTGILARRRAGEK
jgi:hypothetical protein